MPFPVRAIPLYKNMVIDELSESGMLWRLMEKQ